MSIQWLRKRRPGTHIDHFTDAMREGIIKTLRDPRRNARALATEARNGAYGRPATGATA